MTSNSSSKTWRFIVKNCNKKDISDIMNENFTSILYKNTNNDFEGIITLKQASRETTLSKKYPKITFYRSSSNESKKLREENKDYIFETKNESVIRLLKEKHNLFREKVMKKGFNISEEETEKIIEKNNSGKKFSYENNKKNSIPKKIRDMLWVQTYGDCQFGNCKICDEKITYLTFVAAHYISRANGGSDNINNLVCLCSGCNNGMGPNDVEDYINRFLNIKEEFQEEL